MRRVPESQRMAAGAWGAGGSVGLPSHRRTPWTSPPGSCDRPGFEVRRPGLMDTDPDRPGGDMRRVICADRLTGSSMLGNNGQHSHAFLR